jgi:hypothetical protein
MEIYQAGICLINLFMGKKLFLFSIALLFVIAINAQKEVNIFEKVEIEANTNEKAWKEHIAKKTQLPDSILNTIPPGTYKVNVQFIIDKHGNIGQIKAKNDPGFGLAKRAENIVSSYKGTWQPATQCGRNVNAYRTLPITFIVSSQ